MKYDQHENCAKCGYPGKTVEYESRPDWINFAINEWLKLKCARCGFLWTRDCLDKEES